MYLLEVGGMWPGSCRRHWGRVNPVFRRTDWRKREAEQIDDGVYDAGD